MHKWVRHCSSLIGVICLSYFAQGCASSKSGAKARLQRQAIVDYEIIRVNTHNANWAEDFYLDKAKNPDNNALISMAKEADKKRMIFVVDSGARQDDKVACTMVRAQGRELIAESLVRKLYQKVEGKPYDVLILGPGLKVAYDLLGKVLSGDNVLDEYAEGRVIAGNSQLKGQSVFHCALKVAIPDDVSAKIVEDIKELIRKEFYYRSNLEKELKGLNI